jgi:hypothetical protein
VGGKENKGITVKFDLAGPPLDRAISGPTASGTFFNGSLWDVQTPAPPGAFSYGGSEFLNALAVSLENEIPFVYATGQAQSGFSNGGRLFVSKLDSGGSVLWTQTDGIANPYSQGLAVTTLNGNVYVAGQNADLGSSQPYLLKYAAAGGPALWSRKSTSFSGVYHRFSGEHLRFWLSPEWSGCVARFPDREME